MKILINKIHYPIKSLGPGRRLGIWLQGCSIRCRGCVSLDTWGSDPRKGISVAALLDWCQSQNVDEIDGVTISGGEPFDQPEALRLLLQGLTDWRHHSATDFDVLCYSGFCFSHLEQHFEDILQLLDVVVAEPFMVDQPTDKYLCGSANQVLIPLSERGRLRYSKSVTEVGAARQMDYVVADDGVWFAGIPRGGDMDSLRSALAERGVLLRKLSWRA